MPERRRCGFRAVAANSSRAGGSVMLDLESERGREWAAIVAHRFNPNHGVAGQFASAPSSGSSQAKAGHAKQKQALLEQARQDRAQARKLRAQLRQIEDQIKAQGSHKAAKVTKKSVNAAKSAAAKKGAATKQTKAGGGKQQQPAKGSSGGKSLQQQADILRVRIKTLLAAADAAEAKAK